MTRYDDLNASFHARQHQRAAMQLQGWRAWHAGQAGRTYVKRLHSTAWMTGWRSAAAKGSIPKGRGVMLDLCPGTLQDAMRSSGSSSDWACPYCRWSIVGGDDDDQTGHPSHVPVHPLVDGASGASPMVGPPASSLEAD